MHTFRKYISNRGSALFMVISTMTALMITCMAMYFTVLASRSTTYAIFNQKQSYQNSTSIYDMVVNNGLSPTSDLYKQMEKMSVGETLTTPPTEDEYLGTYTVTITKLSENEYDIVVSSTVDGVTETVHNVISITNSTEEVPLDGSPSVSIAPTFAATGYVPNDVYLDKGHFRSDVFFDNEVTYFGAYDSSELFGYGDISCGGSVVMTQGKGMTLCKDNKPITFSVRGNLTVSTLNRDPGLVNGSKVLIGGNLYQSYELKNCDIYVNGDVYLMGGNLNDSSTRYFVNGNIYLTNGAQTPPNLYCNGSLFDENGNPKQDSNVIKDKWDAVVDGNHVGVAGPGTTDGTINGKTVYSYNTIITELDNRTQTNTYYKWTVKDSEISKNGSINHQDIVVNNYNQPAEIVWGSEQWGTGCDVDHIYINGCDGGAGFIIIDTGDDPNNVYTMRLEANRTGPNGEKLFSWTGAKGDNVHIRVLVKGRGSVVFDVPKGVTYQDTDKSIIAHYNFWILCGGKDPHSYTTHNGDSDTKLLNPDTMASFVHKCTGNDCKNSITISEAKDDKNEQIRCSREVAYEVNGTIQHKICNEVKMVAKCSKHDIEVTYCPKCEMSYVQDLEGNYKICKDHVDPSAVKNKAGNSTEYNRDKTTNEVIIPTTNIYFVSCDESANFNFGYRPDGKTFLTSNSTVGYVYAPYITFFANTGGSGNDAVKFMGGMTVSDYNFLSDQTFIMCVPDKSPTDLMDPDDLKQKFKVSKDWKVELVTH